MPNQLNRRRVFRNIKSVGKTDDFTFIVPANCFIQSIIIINNTENAITGGVDFGTTTEDDDVVAAFAVGASAITHVPDADILLRVFSKTVDTTIYVSDVTAWNDANIDVNVIVGRL